MEPQKNTVQHVTVAVIGFMIIIFLLGIFTLVRPDITSGKTPAPVPGHSSAAHPRR